MTRRIITGIVIGIAGALLLPAIGSALHTTEATSTTPVVTATLVEDTTCAMPGTDPLNSGAVGTVAVNVPRITFLYFNAAGAVRAAATNTGCAPRNGDAVYVYAADGSGPVAGTFDLATVKWVGDFTEPGIPQAQL